MPITSGKLPARIPEPPGPPGTLPVALTLGGAARGGVAPPAPPSPAIIPGRNLREMLLTPPAAGEAAAAAHGGERVEPPPQKGVGTCPTSMGLGRGCDPQMRGGKEESPSNEGCDVSPQMGLGR